jgi:hypothetical protein
MKKCFCFWLCATFLMSAVQLATAQFTFIPRNAPDWRYLDNGSDQGTAWTAPTFDDTSWSSGTAELGYGDGDEATVVSFGPDSNNKYVTTYFRKYFAVTNAAQWSNITLRVLRDDGAVVYLNGTEISRQNMPAGPITYQTLAASSVDSTSETTFFQQTLPPTLLVSGVNTIAVEVHQVNPSSSDLSFNLELLGTSTSGGIPPAIVSQPQSQTVTAGSTVTFSVTATGSPVLRYRWHKDGVPLPAGTNSTLTLVNVNSNNAGIYFVIVSNTVGSATSSNAVLTVLPANQLPVVTWIRPTNGATFPAGSTLILTAEATDPDGTVNFVDFFANSTFVGRVSSADNTYNGVWSNAPSGTWQLRAEAVDNSGGRRASTPVQITIGSGNTNTSGFAFIPRRSVWRYLDNGTDQGIAWTDSFFDDSAWASGQAQLGYGDLDEATVVSFGPNSSIKYITTYFRRQFIVTNAADWSAVTLRLLRDDGAVVYLNGTEINRQNMPSGPVTYQTLATVAVNDPEEDAFFEAPVSPGLLVSGLNTIAVEVHQVNPASTDLSFDLELVGTSAAPTPPTIVTQPQSETVSQGANVTFSVTATGTAPLVYQWLKDGVPIPTGTNSPTLRLVNVTFSDAGAYSVVVSNSEGSAASAEAILTVVANSPPIATLLSPTNGSVFRSGQLIILRAQASDPDGTVSFVDFLANNTPVGRVTFGGTNGIYTRFWSNAPSGNYVLRAVATDNQATKGTSAPVSITVLTNRAPTALAQSVTLQEDSSTAITLTGTDPDGDFLTFVVLTSPTHGTLSGFAPNLTYSPNSNYFGPDSFTFAVRDRQFQSAAATVDITVTAVNDAPVAHMEILNTVSFLGSPTIITFDDTATVILNGSASFDVDNDPLAFTWFVGDPPVAFATSAVATNETAPGSYLFQLQVSDGDLTGTAAAPVDVLTPCDAIALMIVLIQDSPHSNGIKRPLIDCLEMTCDAFDKGKFDKAVNMLEAFQDKVTVRLAPVDPELAQVLIDAAQTLIDAASGE